MPFTFYSDKIPAAAPSRVVYGADLAQAALTYDWTAGWKDAGAGRSSWTVEMSGAVGKHMASYRVFTVLRSLKRQGRPTFGDVMVAWTGAGGTLIRIGLLWCDRIVTGIDPGAPPWMSTYDLTDEGLVLAGSMAAVEEVMES